MSRYKKTTASNYVKLIKEGRGQGKGKDYLPWLNVRDVPSTGLSTRILGWKTGRVHQFLSNLELSFFYELEWSSVVSDIREQYPLSIDSTLDIAKRLGIKHPFVSKLDDYAVMTTDFLIDALIDDRPCLIARSVKSASELSSRRTIEKLLIEKTYWEERGVDYKVVTENEISLPLAKNIDFVYTAKWLDDSPGINLQMLLQIELAFSEALSLMPQQGFAKTALNLDYCLGFDSGTCLWAAKHFIANGIWSVDMSTVINPSEPLKIRSRDIALLRELNAS